MFGKLGRNCQLVQDQKDSLASSQGLPFRLDSMTLDFLILTIIE